ncbi:MAG TPA: Hsp33 family molecular chaperone HslO [Burkholderiales bacterium]|jgi:molecular chaperone Hsp33|nr:Hsp33 family molecular chaperone HslO [Burkholderiales bacterium]
MNDTLQRFLFEGAPIRGEVAHLDATWRAVLDRHDYPPVLRTILGELMAAGALLAATLKFEGAILLQLQGNGPVKLIVVESTSEQTLRATAKWSGELDDDASIDTLLGDGRFAVTLVPGDGKQTYQGVVDIDPAGVAASLEHYMRSSEQLDTRLWLAAGEQSAAGLLLQKLPEQDEPDEDSWNRVTTLAETLTQPELLALPARKLLHRLYHQEDIRLFDPRPVSFRCSCSSERVGAMLRMLGHAEVRSILDERDSVEVTCEFCNRAYRYDSVDAEQLFAATVPTQAPATRH